MLILLEGRVNVMALVGLDAQKVRPVNGGQKFNGVEFLTFLADLQGKKQTGTVLKHSQLDRAATVFYDQLGQEAKDLLWNNWARGRTVLGKPEDGGELKRVYTSSESGLSVEVIVPRVILEAYKGKEARGRGVAFDVTDTNSRITPSADGKSATVELLDPDSAIVLKLANSGSWGKANESTLWIPVKEVPDANPTEDRYFNAPKGEFAGALGRDRSDLDDYYGRYVLADRPSFRAGVLEFGQGASAASAELAVAQAAAKPDVRLLAASAEEAVGKLVFTVKPELLQPIIELINATKSQ